MHDAGSAREISARPGRNPFGPDLGDLGVAAGHTIMHKRPASAVLEGNM
jgi:hypothetical protein